MRVKLKDAFTLQMGKTPARADLSLWGGNNKWISIADIGSAGKYISATKECITDEGVSRSGIKVVPKGTVIMSFKLSIGKTAIVSEDMYTNEAIMAFIDNGTYCVDPNYLYHLCCGTDWTQGGNKAVMGLTLNKANLSEIEIELPSIEKQREIAAVLDQLDGIIEKRHDELNAIEQLVKSRFIELFGSEAELDRWPCCTIGDVADVCVGVVIKPTQYYTDKGIPAFRSLNIGEMRVKDADWVYFTEEGHRKNQKSVIHKNDVLVVRSGAPGTACVATEKYEGYNAVDIIIAHPDNRKVNSVFLAAYTNMPHGMTQIREKTGGAAQQHFNVGGYKAMRLIMPPMELQQRFAAFVEQTDKSKLAVQQGLQELEILKKSLMQQYFG